MNSKLNQPEAEETQNDDIVGAALRWSVAVIVLLTVAGASFWWLTQPQQERVATTAGPTALPVPRATPTMVIPEIPFTDITEAAGIDFVHENGAEGEKLLPETMGGGARFWTSTTMVIRICCASIPMSGRGQRRSPNSCRRRLCMQMMERENSPT
jgi:hypothetical protein